MSPHQANLEPLNVFEFLRTVLFVLKAADPCVTSGWPSVLVQLKIIKLNTLTEHNGMNMLKVKFCRKFVINCKVVLDINFHSIYWPCFNFADFLKNCIIYSEVCFG
jgi:hypothetical protein